LNVSSVVFAAATKWNDMILMRGDLLYRTIAARTFKTLGLQNRVNVPGRYDSVLTILTGATPFRIHSLLFDLLWIFSIRFMPDPANRI
jgi:hypothetical protein